MDAESKILAQVSPAATTETTLFRVPANAHALIKELSICNRGSGSATFRVSVSLASAATANEDYLFYDAEIAGNDTFGADIGVTLDAFDIIRIYASNANLSFTLFGLDT